MADNKNKTKPTKLSVAAYIETLTDPAKSADAKALVRLMRAASGEKPTMWGASIIGFGNRHYKYESGREGDMPVIAFSPRKAATVLYLSGLSSLETLLAKLGKHSTGKGCLYIKKVADVNPNVLQSLIEQSVSNARANSPG